MDFDQQAHHRLTNAVSAILFLLTSGTFLFHYLEGWNWVDSFYFTGISLLTIGYGDFVPQEPISKILIVILGFFSVAIAFYSISVVGELISDRLRPSKFLEVGDAQKQKDR